MLYSYEELPIGFEFLGALEVSINLQTSYIRLCLGTKQLSKKTTQPYQPYSMQYLGIQLLHSALACLNISQLCICLSFFLLSLSQLASYICYSKFLRLFKIRYSTVASIKELHLYSFKLYQQVLSFDKQRFCGKKTIKLDMWLFSVTKILRAHTYSYIAIYILYIYIYIYIFIYIYIL